MKKLTDTETPLANFFASGVLALGPKLGPFLWQLPPNLGYDRARMETFFALLPRTAGAATTLAKRHDDRITDDREWLQPWRAHQPLRHAVEVRHESFRDPDFYDLLRREGIALVIGDNPGKWPLIEEQTADFAYVRLHGDTELYTSGYTDEALDRWAAKAQSWQQNGQDVFIYCDNDAKVRAPYDAIGLLQRLGLR